LLRGQLLPGKMIKVVVEDGKLAFNQ
jgi:ATP-dependent Clp protease ATP-binding subunit ClpB